MNIYSCPTCSKYFSSQRALASHINWHKPEYTKNQKIKNMSYSILVSKTAKLKRLSEYNQNPQLCLECDKPISYYQKHHNHSKFCSQSCGAIFHNRKRKITKKCLNCKIDLINQKSKFCSQNCYVEYKKKKTIECWRNNTRKVSTISIKSILKYLYGEKCSKCNNAIWNNQPITLELEHIDGNSLNNAESNVCLLCPNCHSQTPTYKGKNKGNGRHSRMIRYKEGKSY